jgi:hypothetical protein
MPTTATRSLHNIADEIIREWGDKMYFGAVPYVRAMRHVESITDKYGDDSAEDIVIYFLSNARTWRGDVAKRVKAELKGMLK